VPSRPASRPSSATTGIATYLENGGTLEKAAQMAHYASPRMTQLYDRQREETQPRRGGEGQGVTRRRATKRGSLCHRNPTRAARATQSNARHPSVKARHAATPMRSSTLSLQRLHQQETRVVFTCDLPITPSECADDEGRRAMGLIRSHRLSAVVDGVHLCRAQGASVRHCNMLGNWLADSEHDPLPAPRNGRGTRVESIRLALQHDRSATASVARSADLG
jgi:hypothetical protein